MHVHTITRFTHCKHTQANTYLLLHKYLLIHSYSCVCVCVCVIDYSWIPRQLIRFGLITFHETCYSGFKRRMKDGQLLRKIKISVLLIQHHCIVVDMLCTIEMSGLRKKSSKLFTLVCMYVFCLHDTKRLNICK